LLADAQPSNWLKIIADTIWILYAYPISDANIEPKNQKEVNHENLLSSKNLDRLPRYIFEKKYRMCLQEDH